MFRTTSAAVLLCASIALGQQPNPKLTFEVASIKPAGPQSMVRLQGSVDGGPGTPAPGRIRFTDMPLRVLIMRAYEVQSFQVSGPSWMDSQRFDVIAKVPDGASKEDAQIMLQNLLADRFKLKLHKESKEAPIYELVVAKGGIKIKEATQTAAAPAEGAGGPLPALPPRGKDGFLRTPHGQLGIQATANGRMRMQGNAVTMARLTDILEMALGRPVVDKTGLTGVLRCHARLLSRRHGARAQGSGAGSGRRQSGRSSPRLERLRSHHLHGPSGATRPQARIAQGVGGSAGRR